MCATVEDPGLRPAYHCVVVVFIDCAGTSEKYFVIGPNAAMSMVGSPATSSALFRTVTRSPRNDPLQKLLNTFELIATTRSLTPTFPWSPQLPAPPCGML